MAKFVLIDHSIRGIGGHYYEYAIHVLQAAQRAGYDSVLVTNRQFEIPADEGAPWPVLPLFRYDFWGLSGRIRSGAGRYRLARSWFRDRVVSRTAHGVYSRLGYIWLLHRQPGKAVALGAPGVAWLLILFPISYVVGLARAVARVIIAILKPLWSRYPRSIARACRDFGASLLSPIVIVFRYRKELTGWLDERRRVRAFASDLAALLRQMPLSRGDEVFIPTLSPVDMLGLLRCLERDESIQGVTWHLLFRRNIYTGREFGYSRQDEGLRKLRKSFLDFCSKSSRHRVFFYTDTDALSFQYNRLHVAHFATVPIPVSREIRPRQKRAATGLPLKVAYLGDARSEKGYQHLPGVAEDLWWEYGRSGRLQFTLQSNFMFYRPEHQASVVVARQHLQSFVPTYVTVIPRTLKSAEYREVLLEADVALLPYDRDNYYARSSGAVVECLSAGVPVVVPAGCWLSELLSDAIHSYRSGLTAGGLAETMSSMDGSMMKWFSKIPNHPLPIVDGELMVGGQDNQSSTELKVLANATHIRASFRFTDLALLAYPGSFVRIDAEFKTKELNVLAHDSSILGPGTHQTAPPSALFSVPPDASWVRLSMSNAFGSFPITLRDLRVAFLSVPGDCPLSVVGVAYSDPGKLTDSLREILNHYPHYRDSALSFAETIAGRHNPDLLVRQLTTRSKEAHEERVFG